MVFVRPLFFLLGTAVVSSSVLRKYTFPPPFEGYGLPGDPPIIPFGVPNFYPIEARKDCDQRVERFGLQEVPAFAFQEPKLPGQSMAIMDEEDKSKNSETPELETKVIPEAPVLPIPIFPELTARLSTEDNPNWPQYNEEKNSAFFPDAPLLPILPNVPADIEETSIVEPVDIPEGPLLPPLTLPEVPFRIVVEEEPAQIFTNTGLPKFKPIVIPEAPVMPTLLLPELPTRFNIIEESAPVTLTEPELSTLIEEQNPVPIPDAPILPISHNLPAVIIQEAPKVEPVDIFEGSSPPSSTLPVLPVRGAFEEPPRIFTNPESPKFESKVIPEAPMLPTLSFPEIPARVTFEEPAPEVPSWKYGENPLVIPDAPMLSNAPAIINEEFPKVEPVDIPEGPLLPPLTLPELPVRVAAEEADPIFTNTGMPEFDPIVIPEAPVLPTLSFPELPARFITMEESAPFTLTEPEIPTLTEEKNPVIIPDAPILPISYNFPATYIDKAPLTLPEIAPKDVKECSPIVIPEALVFSPYLPEGPIEFRNDEPALTVVEDARQQTKFIGEPVFIPEAPVLPSFSLPEFSIRIAVEKPFIAKTAPELTTPIETIQRPEIPAINPEFVKELPNGPAFIVTEDKEVKPFINGPSPIIFKAPVQIVVEETDLTRFGSLDCIATIVKERLIPNFREGSKLPLSLNGRFKL